MKKAYQWFEIAGSELPQYTFIPSDMTLLEEEDIKPFDDSQEQAAWFLNKDAELEEYLPLYKRSGEING